MPVARVWDKGGTPSTLGLIRATEAGVTCRFKGVGIWAAGGAQLACAAGRVFLKHLPFCTRANYDRHLNCLSLQDQQKSLHHLQIL